MDILHTTSKILCLGSVSWDLVLEIFIIPSHRYISLNRIFTSLEDNKTIRHIRRSSHARQEVSCSSQNAIVEKDLLKKIITKVFSVMPVEEASINISAIYC